MKFANVVVRTKSGKIWRHTPEKPNYLCDPAREIDPTFSGCWTSALEGETVPLNYFITGDSGKGPLSQSRKVIIKRRLKGFFRNRPVTFKNLDAVHRYGVLWVYYYPHYAHEFSEFVIQVKHLAPETIVLGSIDNPLTYIQESLKSSDNFLSFKSFLDACDLFVTWTRGTEPFYRLITITPVVYCPMPYPVEYVRKFFSPAKEKDRVILCAGETSRSDNLMSQLVARRILERYREFHVQVGPASQTKIIRGGFGYRYPPLHAVPLQNGKYEILPYQRWQEFLQTLSRIFLIIHTDVTWAKGRLATDAAGVGAPCIGWSGDSQRELFPYTTYDGPFDVERIFKLTCRLIEEPSFYEKVQSVALSRLEEYSYNLSSERFQKLLDCLASGDFSNWKPVTWSPG